MIGKQQAGVLTDSGLLFSVLPAYTAPFSFLSVITSAGCSYIILTNELCNV